MSNEAQDKTTFVFEGVKISVDENLADDIEILEMVDEIQNENNVVRVVGLCKRLMGQDKFQEVIEAYKKNHKTNRMPATEMEGLVTKLFESLNPKD